MNLNDQVYLCAECKKIVSNSQELLFVEENSTRCFCSEDCIEEFYSVLMTHYEKVVFNLRDELSLFDELIDTGKEENQLVEEISNSPDEIYKLTNELKEEVFFYLKRYPQFFSGLICTRFNQTPAFIFSLIKTASPRLINELRVGERLDLNLETDKDEDQIEEEMNFITMLESKKSQLLSDLLINQKSTDISFEDYPMYESNFNETLSSPDEIYEVKDKEGDILVHYLKSFMEHEHGNFFYIVIGMKKSSSEHETNIYPVLSFPTNDLKLFQSFRIGNRMLQALKN